MLIAEIRRKLPSIEDIEVDGPDAIAQIRGLLRETKEDLLTADVFGVLKYLPRRPYLEEVLTTLSLRNPQSPEFHAALPTIARNVQNLTFQFWPNYPTPVGLADGRTEPDVEISDDRTLILFEAKLGSDFGDRQLERELAVAAHEAGGREFFVILVTPGITPPRFRYGTERLQAADYLSATSATDGYSAEARKLLSENKNRVLWISWETIQKTLNTAHERHKANAARHDESVLRAADMLTDLNALMLLRQIRPFTGFAGLRGAVSTDRPVLLQVTSLRFRETYRLVDAISVDPKPFGWRCPASSTDPANDSLIPLGTCCKLWDLPTDGPTFRVKQSRKSSTMTWRLVGTLERWGRPSVTSGYAIRPSEDKPKSFLRVAHGYDLISPMQSRDLPSGTSGFHVKRSEQ